MNKEYTYDIDKYTIGVDENGEDGIGMTVAKIENGGIKFLGNCYGENARCIDLLIKENQKLKKQLEVGEEQYNDLVEEKESLQEQLSSNTLQLEELKEQVSKGLYNTCLPYSTGYNKAIKDKETQQKEFIEYMNKTIEELECDDADDEEMKGYLIQRIDIFKEILSKFKEIIGSDINVGSIGDKDE